MAGFDYEDEKINKLQKRIEKIMQDDHKKLFAWEGSILVLNIYEAMIHRKKERIIQLIIEEVEVENHLKETVTDLKKRFMALVISITEKILIERILDVEKSFSVLYAGSILMEEAKDKDEVIQVVLASISEFVKCMDNRIKNASHYLIQSVKGLIHINLNTKINIAALAKDLGTSSSYLSRLFHQKEGRTIQEYICQERIRQAEKLLQYSDFTNEEISRCVGFTSLSYFGKILKASTGLTPGKYRQRYRSKGEGVCM